MMIWGGSWGLEESKCHFCFQEGQERKTRELQLSQFYLDTYESHGAANPESYFQTHEEWQGDQEQ